jgi:N-methylhydantoinase A/oxoprolinase/acetone carboxylase beta subunit
MCTAVSLTYYQTTRVITYCYTTAAEVVGVTGEKLRILQSPDEQQIRDDLKAVLAKGITSLAVVFLHSYTFHDHEAAVGRIATELGFTHVSLSCEVSVAIKYCQYAMLCSHLVALSGSLCMQQCCIA